MDIHCKKLTGGKAPLHVSALWLESPLPMRLTRKIECLKRQKKLATKNPATHVSGKYELLQELGQQELLTPDGNSAWKTTAPQSRAGNEGFSQGPEAKPNNWASKRKERMRWKDVYSSQLGQPQRFPPSLHQHMLQPAHPHKSSAWFYLGLWSFYKNWGLLHWCQWNTPFYVKKKTANGSKLKHIY